MLAVHGGAGIFPNPVECKTVCKKAAKFGFAHIRDSNRSCMEAVKYLEDSGLVNCGSGSNLNENGVVECEASLMCGSTFAFGAVAGTKRLKFPVEIAYNLMKKQQIFDQTVFVYPNILIGEGAEKFASDNGTKLYDNVELVSKRSKRIWNQAKRFKTEHGGTSDLGAPNDTVGAIAISADGACSAACSSGGIVMKMVGRMGHASHFGSGCWAEMSERYSICVSSSGCGEALVRTDFSRQIGKFLKKYYDTPDYFDDLSVYLKESFYDNPVLGSLPANHRNFGCVSCIFDREKRKGELVWLHNTAEMCIAHVKNKKDVEGVISTKGSTSPSLNDSFVFSSITFNLS